jgi:hypothetical protein
MKLSIRVDEAKKRGPKDPLFIKILLKDYFFQSAHKIPRVISPIRPCDPRSATIPEMLLITPNERNGTAEPNTTSKATDSPISEIATPVTLLIASVIDFHIKTPYVLFLISQTSS